MAAGRDTGARPYTGGDGHDRRSHRTRLAGIGYEVRTKLMGLRLFYTVTMGGSQNVDYTVPW